MVVFFDSFVYLVGEGGRYVLLFYLLVCLVVEGGGCMNLMQASARPIDRSPNQRSNQPTNSHRRGRSYTVGSHASGRAPPLRGRRRRGGVAPAEDVYECNGMCVCGMRRWGGEQRFESRDRPLLSMAAHDRCHYTRHTYHGAHVLHVADILGQMPHGDRFPVQPLVVLGVVAGGADLGVFVCIRTYVQVSVDLEERGRDGQARFCFGCCACVFRRINWSCVCYVPAMQTCIGCRPRLCKGKHVFPFHHPHALQNEEVGQPLFSLSCLDLHITQPPHDAPEQGHLRSSRSPPPARACPPEKASGGGVCPVVTWGWGEDEVVLYASKGTDDHHGTCPSTHACSTGTDKHAHSLCVDNITTPPRTHTTTTSPRDHHPNTDDRDKTHLQFCRLQRLPPHEHHALLGLDPHQRPAVPHRLNGWAVCGAGREEEREGYMWLFAASFHSCHHRRRPHGC